MARLWANQNPPLPVRFLGWESDTFTLGRHGWEVAIHDDIQQYHDRSIAVVLRHPKAGLVAHGRIHIAYGESRELLFGSGYFQRALPPIELDVIGSEVNMISQAPLAFYKGMTLRDTIPTSYPADGERFRLGNLPIFAPQGGNPADDLIVDPAQVQELLDKILAFQSPRMRDIRQREARRERVAQPERQVHGQIVTLLAA